MKSNIKRMLAFEAFLAALYFLFRMHPSLEVTGKGNSFSQPVWKLNKKVNACNKSFPIAFVKIHKTGSTTIRRVLEKYTKKHRARNKISVWPFPFAGGYPGPFRRDLALVCTSRTNCQPLNISDRRGDVFMEHHIFNRGEVAKSMKPDVRYLTIIREPVRQFESSFYYYYGRFGVTNYSPNDKIVCFFYPYLHVTGGRWVTLSQYIAIAENSLNESAPWFFRSRNSQAFELGLDPLKMDKKYILQEAKKLDETFDLVMIFEYMPESLILLKNILCMDWQDIILSKWYNSGKYAPLSLSETETSIVKKLTIQDEVLYNYFNATFWRKVDEYGREKMAKDKEKLQRLFAEKWPKPKNMNAGPPINKKPPKRANTLTRRNQGKTAETMNLMREILKQEGFSLSNETAYEMARYMVENSGWCPI